MGPGPGPGGGIIALYSAQLAHTRLIVQFFLLLLCMRNRRRPSPPPLSPFFKLPAGLTMIPFAAQNIVFTGTNLVECVGIGFSPLPPSSPPALTPVAAAGGGDGVDEGGPAKRPRAMSVEQADEADDSADA